MESYPIMHPHRILSYLCNEIELQVDLDGVREFWTHSRNMCEPWALESPATNDHVPIGLWGDSARLWTVYRVEKQMTITLNLPLFRPRSTRHSRFVLFSIPAEKLFKNRTLNGVFRRLTWSINACFSGFNPTQGVGGRPLSGSDVARSGLPLTKQGYAFALVEVRGDWEFHRDVWRPTSSWQGICMCFRCPAMSKGPEGFLYYNNQDNCLWGQQEFTLSEFVSQRLKERNLCD